MSATNVIDLLRKLFTLHSALLQLSLKKTEILKTGDITALDEHIKDEQKYLIAIRQIENERVELINKEYERLNVPGEQTLSTYIEYTNEPERSTLVQLQKDLVDKIHELKAQNDLNQQLTNQSLQVVNITLDMMLPKEKDLNYGNPISKPQETQTRRSMFDSKA